MVLFALGRLAALPVPRRALPGRLHKGQVLGVCDRRPGQVVVGQGQDVLGLLVVLRILVLCRIAAHQELAGGDEDHLGLVGLAGGEDGRQLFLFLHRRGCLGRRRNRSARCLCPVLASRATGSGVLAIGTLASATPAAGAPARPNARSNRS